MPYIYKYVNRKTKDVEYVGISSTEDTFYKRIAAHEKDPWYEHFKYDIYYAVVDSRCDAEALEGHFIAHYGSDKFHNISKSRWGECSFAPLFIDWIKYDPATRVRTKADYNKKMDELQGRIMFLSSSAGDIDREIRVLSDELYDVWHGVKRARRSTVRQWFNDTLGISYERDEQTYKADKSFLFELFNNWLESNSPEWDFDDEDDFWDAMIDTPEFNLHIHGNEMYSLITLDQKTNILEKHPKY